MICAVVVTFNRKQMLVECVEALLNQTIKPDKILVLDNASTDGTKDLLIEKDLFDKIVYKRLKNNMTAAGGFYWGMRCAYNLGADYLWIMDDDVAPKEDALEAFIGNAKILNYDFSFLASAVYGYDNVPMNVPTIDSRPSKNGYADWYTHLNDKMVKIEIATYVSLFITRETIENVGLPYWRMGQWGVDTEHTKRMSQFKPAYFCGNSNVLHKRINSASLSPLTEKDKNRVKLYFSYYESQLILYKYYYRKSTLLKYKIKMFFEGFKALKKKYRFIRIHNIYKGYFRYLFGTYNKKDFKNRYNNTNEAYKEFIEEE